MQKQANRSNIEKVICRRMTIFEREQQPSPLGQTVCDRPSPVRRVSPNKFPQQLSIITILKDPLCLQRSI